MSLSLPQEKITNKLQLPGVPRNHGNQDTNTESRNETEAGSPPETKPERNPVLRYDQVYDLRTSQTRLVKSAKSNLGSKKHRNVVLIVRRIINEKGLHTETEIDIKSSRLAKVLQEINSDVEGVTLQTTPPQASPELFYHCRFALKEKLELAKQELPVDQGLVKDLEIALKFTEEQHSATIENVESLLSVGKITWQLLWTLYPPNTLIYRHHPYTEEEQILRCRTMQQEQHMDKSWYWALNCDIIVDDGAKFGIAKEPVRIEVDEFHGSRIIRDMSVIPLAYHEEEVRLRTGAIERGKRYASINKPRVVETHGFAVSEDRNDYWRPFYYKFATHGRAIIDPTAYRTYQSGSTLVPHVYQTLPREKLSEEQLMICTPVVLGFSFGDKKWGGLPMSRLRDITWNNQAFQQLVMEKRSKMLVHSLVKQHSPTNDGIDDFIAGKGKGLVAMFSGPPGCGKTLTAEAVAEITRRPLYAVSAGELGIKPDDVDKRLERVLELSRKWGAVLLLDEADVFLQARSFQDVTRNALVSIFLRQLEYFDGILILTTNRISNCDPAFESRIHVTIEYPELDRAARQQVWNAFLDKAKGSKNDLQVGVTDDEVAKLSDLEVNGRQIKNIIIGARTLAKELNETLEMSHINLVLGVVSSRRSRPMNAEEGTQPTGRETNEPISVRPL